MNNNNNMMVPEGQYSHSLKLDETANGIRISVRVYANDQQTLIEEAFGTYLKVIQTERDSVLPQIKEEEHPPSMISYMISMYFILDQYSSFQKGPQGTLR